MLTSLLVLCVAATDVTSAASRSQTLLDYINGREDLSTTERRDWESAVRLEFGGKAIKDGTDEGVTSAKSVIAAAVFHGIQPKDGAKAAYDAYHDTYRYVPPPIAVGYQILKFAGRAPKASPRELAFNFPRYFNEEMAPDVVRYWGHVLAAAKLTASEKAQLERNVQKTRELMRPMLRERLWFGAELEARLAGAGRPASADAQIRDDLARLAAELQQDFAGVGKVAALDATRSYYERYEALSRELGQKAKARPARAPAPAPTPVPDTRPTAPPSVGKDNVTRPPAVPTRDAPVAGDTLVSPAPGWLTTLGTVIGSWLGVPYQWGGLDKHGVDCSGFTQSVFANVFAVQLPRNSRAQAMLGQPVERAALRAGDLVFFDTFDRGSITHVGIYLGDDRFAHASSSKGVVRDALTERYYVHAYHSARRVLAQ